MAEDEQFSLCWNNFNSNLSAGFHESLCRGDLVDVTLAAEGQLVKAHRLVLSVCSPYFRKMFTQMPSNQHAFVFLKDVSHSALKDLIQFMYCGEVNVKQDALPAFISTAEALQIKGLTETGENVPQTQQHTTGTTTVLAASSPAPTITKETTARITTVPVHQTIATTSRPIKISRPTAATYKLESEDSSDDKVVHAITVQAPTVKRTQKSITPQSAPASKRIKITTTTADPLEAVEPTQITIQDKDDEFINLPIETLNTKSEPHDSQYGDQASAQVSEVETQEDNSAYVEDDGGYADMTKYDESYFTEGDEKPGQSSFGESFTGTTEQGQEAQDSQNKAKIISVKSLPLGATISIPYIYSTSEDIISETQSQSPRTLKKAKILTNDNIKTVEFKQKSMRKKQSESDLIALHKGCNIKVSKTKLLEIYTPHPALYTIRLAQIVFGKETLSAVSKESVGRAIDLLDQDILNSLVEHVLQIYKGQEKKITAKLVKDYLNNKLNTLHSIMMNPT